MRPRNTSEIVLPAETLAPRPGDDEGAAGASGRRTAVTAGTVFQVASVSKPVAAMGGVRMVTHDGTNRGWRALIAAFPQRGWGIAVLTNGENGEAVVDAMMDQLVG